MVEYLSAVDDTYDFVEEEGPPWNPCPPLAGTNINQK